MTAELIAAGRRIAALVPTSEAGETLTGLADALENAQTTLDYDEAVMGTLVPAPRVVSTVAELDALPPFSVLHDGETCIVEKMGQSDWIQTGERSHYSNDQIVLPATVLWVGGTE